VDGAIGYEGIDSSNVVDGQMGDSVVEMGE
jgi:hypothetical protein